MLVVGAVEVRQEVLVAVEVLVGARECEESSYHLQHASACQPEQLVLPVVVVVVELQLVAAEVQVLVVVAAG